MGFDIPEPYCWDESFKVFYEKLDEEHKGLFKGIFDVAAKPTCSATLAHLVDAVAKHFATEEAMMDASKNYGDKIAGHKKAHTDFLEKINKLSTPVSGDTVHFAKDWLVTHIKGTDFTYKGQL